ncbi:MAG TPA: beta-ketoacyl-ACP synthase II [Thermodesulfobacteriota bacterium]|nr:beta-ketoacyl-ACP synthase II [Thermodesulfobacteriota bacterium]
MSAERRVVVTGLGLVTPLGTGVEKTWSALVAGRSGIGPITRFDASAYETRIAGEVRDFQPEAYLDRKDLKRMDTFIQYAVAAAQMAVDDAGLTVDEANAERVGVLVGAGLGGLPAIERTHQLLLERGPGRVSPFFIPMVIVNLAPGYIAMRFGAKGPNLSSVSACATGNHAIGDAGEIIKRGDADVMIAGGAESTISPLCISGFNAMKALSTRNDAPAEASRPFDRGRDGFVCSEGAGIVVLEEYEHARRRGARIYAELVGYGATADAYHVTNPSPGGEGAARAMRAALRDARLNPEDVDYINAHATSTPAGDIAETQAIKAVFGDRARRIPVSATKSMTGHLLGAAGGVEAIFTILTIARGVIPPTINLHEPDPECDLDYVPNEARQARVNVGLSNGFGFGGTNSTLAFRRI